MTSENEMVIRPEDTAAKSDQLNADDLMGRTLLGVVTGFRNVGTKDQPWHIKIDTWPQPWKPSKGQRRILQDAWGTEPKAFIGRAVELVRDPTVPWSGEPVGGVVIGGLSHIGHDRVFKVTVSRGKKKDQHVRCLPEPKPAQTFEDRRAALVAAVSNAGLLDDADAKFGPVDEWDALTCKNVAAWLREVRS